MSELKLKRMKEKRKEIRKYRKIEYGELIYPTILIIIIINYPTNIRTLTMPTEHHIANTTTKIIQERLLIMSSQY